MKKLITYISIITLLISCNNDFLDRTSESQMPSSAFYSSEYEATQAIFGVYTKIADFYPAYYIILLDAITDNGTLTYTPSKLYPLALGTHNASNGDCRDFWKHYYRGIRLANDVLKNVDKVDTNDAFKNRIKAEARFLRAWFYYYLIISYGDVPYFEDKVSIRQKDFIRMPVADVLQKIVADLDFAITNLPEATKVGNKSRASKSAAYALKSRALLYFKDFQNAYKAAQNVIGKFELFPDFGGLWLKKNESNIEVIWELEYLNEVKGNYIDVYLAPAMLGGWTSLSPSQNLVDEFETTDGLTIDDPKSIYDSSNPWTNRDPRMRHSILFHGDVLNGKTYTVTAGGSDNIGGSNATRTGYASKKFFDPVQGNGGGNPSARNWPLIRYAEVLLNYAEAKIEDNNIDQSVLDAINTIRARAYGTTVSITDNYPEITTTDQSELRKIIRRERRVELAFEGFRLYDIRRWRIANDVMNGKLKGYNPANELGKRIFDVETRSFNPERDYLWPIHIDELLLMGISENNPNY